MKCVKFLLFILFLSLTSSSMHAMYQGPNRQGNFVDMRQGAGDHCVRNVILLGAAIGLVAIIKSYSRDTSCDDLLLNGLRCVLNNKRSCFMVKICTACGLHTISDLKCFITKMVAKISPTLAGKLLDLFIDDALDIGW